MKRKRIFPFLIFLLIAILAIGLFLAFDRSQLITTSRTAIEMGTAVSLTLHGRTNRVMAARDREMLGETLTDVLDRIGELDESVLSWRSDSSEVYRFNAAGTELVKISPELADAVRQSLELSERSNGAVDITLRPLIEAWGIESYDGSQPYEPPTEDELRAIAPIIGAAHLTLEGDSLRKDDPAMRLDLGAVGKGYALDAALPLLRDAEQLSGAVLAVGGSILTWGDKGSDWQVAIRDPEGSPNDYLGILSIPGQAGLSTFISTSGGYEKFVETDGVIYEHILSAETLRPAETDLSSVTVVTTDSGLASDGLSTACYLLGMDGSRELLAAYHAEAIFVTRDRGVYLTDGLRGCFSLLNAAYRIETEMP